MNKPFAYFDNIDTFKKKKVSGTPTNDAYIDFSNNEILSNDEEVINFILFDLCKTYISSN